MRHIEKLKKIFACCGKECTAETNGQALDQLVTLAENGGLGEGVVYEHITINASVDSTPIVYDCSDKKFIYMNMTRNGGRSLYGISGDVEQLTEDITYEYSSSGMISGTFTWVASTKTLTYTPNPDFNRGATPLTIVLF